ncbi:alpha/beta hydrolase [Bosea sp. (in: a-proteobacteria)]|uniref:alpha/beta fold hydrolase n=1 Tax=Bosea sp. (in: a-proteobacteria) TaxID=1871050 RepID=UPI00334217B1
MSSPLLEYEVTGDDRRLGLLLLHPLGADLRYWDACIAQWRGKISCLAPNLRHRVDGQRPRPVTLEEQASDLEALRAALGFERVVPVGSAISTMAAACYAARHPERTAALVLANATARSLPQAASMLAERAEAVRAGGMAAILPQAVERAFLNLPKDRRYNAYLAAFGRQSANDYAFACLASATFDASALLPEIRCPSLVVAGEHDVLLPPALGQEAAALIPGARFEIMQGAAHFLPYQRPEAFAALVDSFLASTSR